MKFISFFIIPFCLAALFSCGPAGVRKMNIARLLVNLQGVENPEKNGLIPGKWYSILLTLSTKEAKKIPNPDYRDFFLNCPNGTIQNVKQTENGLSIQTTDNPYILLDGRSYEGSILVISNAFAGAAFHYPVNWSGYSNLDWSGVSGQAGNPGVNGSSDSSIDYPNGWDGMNGLSGEFGRNGQSLTLEVAFYRIQDFPLGKEMDRMIVIHAVEDNRVYLLKAQKITIHSSGGNGGDGGPGGDGGKGFQDLGFRGRGGSGGTGGNGGSGGNITVIAGGFPVEEYLNFDVTGGSGGQGGLPGKGSYSGSSGRNGKNGANGTVVIKNLKTTDELFLNVHNPHFDRNRLE